MQGNPCNTSRTPSVVCACVEVRSTRPGCLNTTIGAPETLQITRRRSARHVSQRVDFDARRSAVGESGACSDECAHESWRCARCGGGQSAASVLDGFTEDKDGIGMRIAHFECPHKGNNTLGMQGNPCNTSGTPSVVCARVEVRSTRPGCLNTTIGAPETLQITRRRSARHVTQRVDFDARRSAVGESGACGDECAHESWSRIFATICFFM
ncbi:hypothetical protein NECAME_10639 [Necator americanus]|uniref:Uncharacterized protein n=1 Tax=Necator americanus TaxID=51031 RepID=W2T9X3_NECAM|nr:hypothetical protein NECAME_10639 [Necator americanus]ETN78011.1 hypothetical protein NECAME_10639 [Necator americanus]